MAYLQLEDLEFYAYHGHFKEEQQVGNKFLVNILVQTDIEKTAQTDNLNDAVDYVKIYKVVEEEMQKTSKLLETVVMRIVKRLFNDFPNIEYVDVTINKLNPPLGGKAKCFSVKWIGSRNQISM
ncbi:MAG: dihydroneopterin aldolase [Bacteroidales bacterium]|nr:dihydroneopterin aldolase [Bacteroidales bacterium]